MTDGMGCPTNHNQITAAPAACCLPAGPGHPVGGADTRLDRVRGGLDRPEGNTTSGAPPSTAARADHGPAPRPERISAAGASGASGLRS